MPELENKFQVIVSKRAAQQLVEPCGIHGTVRRTIGTPIGS